jgi:hypothetical protein
MGSRASCAVCRAPIERGGTFCSKDCRESARSTQTSSAHVFSGMRFSGADLHAFPLPGEVARAAFDAECSRDVDAVALVSRFADSDRVGRARFGDEVVVVKEARLLALDGEERAAFERVLAGTRVSEEDVYLLSESQSINEDVRNMALAAGFVRRAAVLTDERPARLLLAAYQANLAFFLKISLAYNPVALTQAKLLEMRVRPWIAARPALRAQAADLDIHTDLFEDVVEAAVAERLTVLEREGACKGLTPLRDVFVCDHPIVSSTPGKYLFLVYETNMLSFEGFPNVGVDVDVLLRVVSSIMAQVLLILEAAQHYLRFVHSDLHTGNVMLERFEGDFLRFVRPDGRVVRIPAAHTNHLRVRLIDYGRSRCDAPGNGATERVAFNPFSPFGSEDYDAEIDMRFLAHDVGVSLVWPGANVPRAAEGKMATVGNVTDARSAPLMDLLEDMTQVRAWDGWQHAIVRRRPQRPHVAIPLRKPPSFRDYIMLLARGLGDMPLLDRNTYIDIRSFEFAGKRAPAGITPTAVFDRAEIFAPFRDAEGDAGAPFEAGDATLELSVA